MAAQTKVKNLQAPVFKARKTQIPQKFWKSLLVRSEGAAVTSILEEWGAPDIAARPAITLLVSSRETTGRITSSKLVMRGPLFVAGRSNPLKANMIWPNLEEDITRRFSIPGEGLNFSNREARNFHLWTDLTSLPNLKVYKGDTQLSPEEARTTLGEGAGVRVAIQTYSVTYMEAVLLVVPNSVDAIRERPATGTWRRSPTCSRPLTSPATGPGTSSHTAVNRLLWLSQPLYSPQTVTQSLTVSTVHRLSSLALTINSQRTALTGPQSHGLRPALTVSRLSQHPLISIIAGTANPTWWNISRGKIPEKDTGWESSRYWKSWARPTPTTSPFPPPTPSRWSWPVP